MCCSSFSIESQFANIQSCTYLMILTPSFVSSLQIIGSTLDATEAPKENFAATKSSAFYAVSTLLHHSHPFSHLFKHFFWRCVLSHFVIRSPDTFSMCEIMVPSNQDLEILVRYLFLPFIFIPSNPFWSCTHTLFAQFPSLSLSCGMHSLHFKCTDVVT